MASGFQNPSKKSSTSPYMNSRPCNNTTPHRGTYRERRTPLPTQTNNISDQKNWKIFETYSLHTLYPVAALNQQEEIWTKKYKK